MNYEYVHGSINYRGTVKPESEITLTPTDKELYLSMFGFDDSIYPWIEYNQSVSKFNGNYFCRYLFFDIDCKDLQQAQEHAKELVRMMYQNLSINPQKLFICFSGSKGFHIGLHQNLFGGFGFAKDLPLKIRALACIVSGVCYEMPIESVEQEYLQSDPKSFRGIDLGIYNANRIFRAINSLNAKSGLYKIGLSANELFHLSIEQIQALAQTPRTNFALSHQVSELTPIDELVDCWRQASEFTSSDYVKTQQPTTTKLVNTEAFFCPPSEGDRNNSLFKQAAMLFDHSDLSKESVRQLIDCINLASKNPLPEKEIDTLVKSAYSRTNSHDKPFQSKEVVSTVENFSHWVDDWVDYQTSERKPLTMLIPEFDGDSEYDYRGKLVCLIGGAGSMKSYFAQNVLRENIHRYGSRCAYASMEMSKVQNVNRFFDLVFDAKGIAASRYLKEVVKSDKKRFYNEVSGMVSALSGKLLLSNKSNVSTDYLRKWIFTIMEVHGTVDILLVDGASMMEGASVDEIKAMNKHSEQLKALANELNICIMVIFHLTKDIKPYERGIARSARGSGKIIDNGDMFLGFSKLIDPSRSAMDNIKYVFGYGHINYWNKRGQGQEMDVIFECDPVTNVIKHSIRQPEEFMTFEEFSRLQIKKATPKNEF